MDDTTRAELDHVMSVCLDLARRLLVEHGAFFPFGVSLTADGIVMDAVYDGKEHAPDDAAVVDRIVATHRALAGQGRLHACGTVLDLRLATPEGEEEEAVCIDVEHRAAGPRRWFLPYSRAGHGEVEYGEAFSIDIEPEVFAD